MSGVVIVGGGVIGSSIAYHLAAAGMADVTVIERDPAYTRASSALSASSIRQQFTTPTCIAMSRFGFAFLRDASTYLAVDDEPVELSLVERGYLYLAEAGQAAQLDAAIAIQHANGVPVRRIVGDALSAEMPWLNSDGIALAALGEAQEGWFDGYSLLQAFRRKARSLGVRYRHDEAVGLIHSGDRATCVRLASGETIDADVVVDAAGPNAAAIAHWAGVDLPVVPERRCIFAFRCEQSPGPIPLVIDPTGLYVRPEGDIFIAGGPATPLAGDDPFALEVDYAQFDEFIWPVLANRIPAFEAIRMVRAWAGHYEMNTFDHNAVIGWAPGVAGLMIAAGFSGHGMQHAPAAGRGVAELILNGCYKTLDLSTLSPERLVRNTPIVELNII